MGWVVDLDGVVWLGEWPIPGGAEAVRLLRGAGHDVLFLTNNSSAPVRAVEEKLARMGIEADGAVVTSAVIAADLVEAGSRVLGCCGEGARIALEARGVEVIDPHETAAAGAVDAVVVGYHDTFDYRSMTSTVRALLGLAERDENRSAGPRPYFIATNNDRTYPTTDGLLPGCGAILASIAWASQIEPTVAGKPTEIAARHLRDRLGPRGVVVGDRFDTDGAFASVLGYDFVVVTSGVTRSRDLPVLTGRTRAAEDLLDAVRTELADGDATTA